MLFVEAERFRAVAAKVQIGVDLHRLVSLGMVN
jgi:hypothetical protein